MTNTCGMVDYGAIESAILENKSPLNSKVESSIKNHVEPLYATIALSDCLGGDFDSGYYGGMLTSASMHATQTLYLLVSMHL